jgi:anaerobic magnesium-protoporphyrin IX monomethyl ester cyclase
MSQSDIALVFPPQWDPCYPHLALPSLKAFLDGQGYRVKQYDANVHFYDWLLSRTTLETLYDRVMEQDSTDPSLQHRIQFFKSVGEHFAANIDDVKARFREGGESRQEIIMGLQLCLYLASCAYQPTTISLDAISMPYSTSSLTECFRAVHDVKTNPFRDFFITELIPSVLQIDPAVIGISVTATSQLISTLTLAALIREEHPHIHITLGGNTLSRFADEPERFKRLFDVIDSIVLFDGEPALEVLLDRLESGRSLEDVPNLVTFSHGKVHRSPVTQFADVNTLPTPNFDGLNLRQYFFPVLILPLLTARGCYWHRCAFCSHFYAYGDEYRSRKIDSVLEDLQTLSRSYSTRYFGFVDESIPVHTLSTLADGIIAENVDVRFAAEVRFEKGFTPEVLSRIHQAGCRMLAFGLESGCQRVSDFMRKGIDIQNASHILKHSTNAGIWNHVFFFFGFPTETVEEAQETLQFIKAHRDIIKSISYDVFRLDRDSDVYSHPQKYQVEIIDDTGGEFALSSTYDVHSGLSQREAVKFYRENRGDLQSLFRERMFDFGWYRLLVDE